MSSADAGEPRFVGRGALKLDHALREFGLSVAGLAAADFGCNIGGFTDCLLRRGAARVVAIDTGYGTLAYALRTDPRVVVMERTSALHAPPPDRGVDLVVIDMGWTPQRLCIPAALKWLRGPESRIVTLIKPHYEAGHGPERALLTRGALDEPAAQRVLERVVSEIPALGAAVLGVTRSPVEGGKSARKGKGNIEFLALLAPSP